MPELRPIPGHDGYCAGSDGKIYSCWSRIGANAKAGQPYTKSDSWRPLQTHINRTGYVYLRPKKDGKFKHSLAHRLVAMAFIGEPPAGTEVCHFDGNRANNVPSNLRYDTRTANLQDRKRHGTWPSGERNGNARLNETKVREIRELKGKMSQQKIADQYGINQTIVSDIFLGVLWASVQ